MFPPDILTIELAVALAASGFAGVMRGFAGFGTAVLFSPLFTLLWGPQLGVTLVVLLELPISLQLLPGAAPHVRWPEMAALSVPALAAVPVGGFLLVALDPVLVKRIIGALVLAFALAMLSGWRYRGPRPLALTAVLGTGSGVLKGITGFAGPPVVVYLLSGPESARYHRATLIVYFAFINAIAVPPFWYYGLITANALWLTVLILPAVMAGVWVGSRLFAGSSDRLFRRIALVFLMGIALLAIGA